MAEKRLKIAYLCDISPLHTLPYSGGNTRIYNALREHAGDVTILSNSWHIAEPVRQALMRSPDSLNLRLRWRTHLVLAGLIARGVRRELAKAKYDVLFGAYSFQSMSRITTPYPMVKAFTADATQTVYQRSEVGQQFGSYMKASRLLDPLVLRAETQLYNALDLLFWPSEWLKAEADRTYGLPEGKAHVVPWGANVADPGPALAPPLPTKTTPLELLFIGRDWFAKGGPLVFDTLQELTARGIPARLSVIGCHPPDFHRNEHVNVLGHLDRSKPADHDAFENAMRSAHVMFMPSFESYGFAFCEASAYGLPSLCLRVGGVPVRDGINGFALPIGTPASEFADILVAQVFDPEIYEKLRETTRQEYLDRLNWDAWGKTVSAKLRDATSHFL